MDELKGVGHFSIWFILGYIAFKLILNAKKSSMPFQMYGPFIPILLGFIATIPYQLASLGLIPHESLSNSLYNIFLFYEWLNRVDFLVAVFSRFELAVFLDAFAYLLLLRHYIALVKRTRREYAK